MSKHFNLVLTFFCSFEMSKLNKKLYQSIQHKIVHKMVPNLSHKVNIHSKLFYFLFKMFLLEYSLLLTIFKMIH
jgi:hypothetical protein